MVLVKALRVPKANIHCLKLLPLYEGPYIISNKVSEHTFTIKDLKDKIRGLFHASLLKPYYVEPPHE